ncbi:MAG: 7-carboxy-7-deazaguanine synthase QueE [Chitinophagaceae bacterium]|nr:7-carboxy-7-deazaguanine synthase QueE [Chitinophagaceae bacterium]
MQTLPLMESFYSIQGEGEFQGEAAYFIRLGGCDVGCFWCDVKDSWEAKKHPLTSIESILKKGEAFPTKLSIITGGEPLMYDMLPLTTALQTLRYRTHIETSGSYPLTGIWDWICLSPKKFKKPLPEITKKANELKIILYNKSDFQWAEEYKKLVNPQCKLFLQPEWSAKEKMLPLLIEYVKQNPQWKISIQIHKYINVE